jgi:hypothetical protein
MRQHSIDPIAQLQDTFESAHLVHVAQKRAFERATGPEREAIWPALLEARAAEEAASAAYRAALWEAIEALELTVDESEQPEQTEVAA